MNTTTEQRERDTHAPEDEPVCVYLDVAWVAVQGGGVSGEGQVSYGLMRERALDDIWVIAVVLGQHRHRTPLQPLKLSNKARQHRTPLTQDANDEWMNGCTGSPGTE